MPGLGPFGLPLLGRFRTGTPVVTFNGGGRGFFVWSPIALAGCAASIAEFARLLTIRFRASLFGSPFKRQLGAPAVKIPMRRGFLLSRLS